MNKRKGVDFSSPNSSSSLKVLSWSEIKKSLEEKQKVEFGWSNKLKNVLPQCRLDKEHEQLNESANAIKDSLQNQIAEARLACDEEQSDLSCLNGKIHSMEKEVEQIQKATSDLQEDQTKLQERIKEYQNEISKCQVELNSEEVEMMKQVPKIKSQISLYAKTTGIKWDYNSEHILAGQVGIKSIGVVSRFSIDPRKHDSFYVANYLWSKMEAPKTGNLFQHGNSE